MIVDSLRTVAGYPLRQLGLDPGHADRQFQPSAARTVAAPHPPTASIAPTNATTRELR